MEKLDYYKYIAILKKAITKNGKPLDQSEIEAFIRNNNIREDLGYSYHKVKTDMMKLYLFNQSKKFANNKRIIKDDRKKTDSHILKNETAILNGQNTFETYDDNHRYKDSPSVKLLSVLQKYPGILKDHIRIKALLKDLFPQEKVLQNSLYFCVDEGLIEKIEKTSSLLNSEKHFFSKKLEETYGISHDIAKSAVEIWENTLSQLHGFKTVYRYKTKNVSDQKYNDYTLGADFIDEDSDSNVSWMFNGLCEKDDEVFLDFEIENNGVNEYCPENDNRGYDYFVEMTIEKPFTINGEKIGEPIFDGGYQGNQGVIRQNNKIQHGERRNSRIYIVDERLKKNIKDLKIRIWLRDCVGDRVHGRDIHIQRE